MLSTAIWWCGLHGAKGAASAHWLHVMPGLIAFPVLGWLWRADRKVKATRWQG